mmetsp:Transcript_3100/g.4188  ORF Transcript_3100/g.4188 Transcript_3100/m.4188 type:complete len:375 (+) Transcript_3100:96-1220(+)|eukprot:CAMPEP_0198143840 /NCGR_PEP_ID=MMETSP1443-20131203/10813_1 /TAXON_ID=186043 /ORGANISM="Entomoneis sp., Strain CCMP2396" /LENGTH=374 /DNA_ID=CAMNT_0043807129 /DNA_START=35 /DNA_END=1159 /DNA_ORIENTATION=+
MVSNKANNSNNRRNMKKQLLVAGAAFFMDRCSHQQSVGVHAFSTTAPTSTRNNNAVLFKRRVEAFPFAASLSYAATTSNLKSSTSTADATTQIETEPVAKAWNDDGFVFGMEGSGLARTKGRTSRIVVEGDSLETQPYQQVMVGLTFAGHAWFLSQAFASMLATANGNVALAIGQATALTCFSWLMSDLGSGILHWSVDNYGNGRTPIMGSIIAAFQGHHSAQWTITERAFCNNVHKLCIPFGVIPMAVIQFLAGGPGMCTWFFAIFCSFEILSQEFHKWAHQLPSETPGWVNRMQKMGISVGRRPHALHHMAPYKGNYCIVSGVCNNVLDTSGFFRRLERFVYSTNGVEANAWKLDAELRERTLSGDYSLPAK